MKRILVLTGVLLICAWGTAWADTPDFDKVELGVIGSFVQSVETDDLDNDGNLDLVAASFLPKAVVVYFGDGNGAFPYTVKLTGDSVFDRVVTGYFDDDDQMDLLACRFSTGEARVFLNNGDRTFSGLPTFSLGLTGIGPAISVGFVNNDAYADFIVCANSTARLYFGNGDGTFAFGHGSLFFGNGTVLVDLDDDGDDDVVACYGQGNGIRLYLNNGNGGFTQSASTYAPAPDPALGVRGHNVVDFNGDGYPDIVVINGSPATAGDSEIQVVMTDGSGGIDSVFSQVVPGSAWGVCVLDYNNDSKLDLLTSNSDEMRMLIYLGDGSGGVTDTLEFSTAPNNYYKVVAADFREDGQWDIFAGAIDNGTAVFLNNAEAMAPLSGGELVAQTRKDIGLRLCNPQALTVDHLTYTIAGAHTAIRDVDLDGSVDKQVIDLNVQDGVYYAEVWSTNATAPGTMVDLPVEVGGETLVLAKDAPAPTPGQLVKLAIAIGNNQPVSPRSGGTVDKDKSVFDWSASAPQKAVSQYAIQVSTSWDFTAPEFEANDLTTPQFTAPAALVDGEVYYWRYRSFDGAWSDYSDIYVATAMACNCPHQGDMDADAVIDAVDLNVMIAAMFFNGSNPQDPTCPTMRADLNNDSAIDLVDLNTLIGIVFFNGDDPVDPCGL